MGKLVKAKDQKKNCSALVALYLTTNVKLG